MKDTCYLTLTKRGVKKMTKSMPKLAGGEVAVKVTVEVPDEHFRDPYVEAFLKLTEEHLTTPQVDVGVEVP